MFSKNVANAVANVDKPKAGFSLPFSRGASRRRAVSKGYRKTAALLEFAARFTGAEDTSPVMEETLRALVRDTGGDLGYIMLFAENEETLTAELAISIGEKRAFPHARRMGEGIEGYVAATGETLMFSRRGRKTQTDFDFDGEAALCVPLMRTRPDGSPHQICGTLTVSTYRAGAIFNERDLELAQSLAALSIVTLANESRYKSLRNSFLQSLQAMARAIEAKVPFMEGHGDRVAHVCTLLGGRLGLTEDVLDDLRSGAQLHEIGKIGIPDTILLKPGQLTPEEFTALKQYSVIGYDMCKPLGLGEQVLTLIRNHPERLDGTGYPDKLKYGELPLPLRILCVADAFDAMSSYRPYRQVMDTKSRQEQLNRFAGTQFDPIVVETLKSLLAEGRLETLYEEHWAKYAERPETAAEPPALVREQQPAAAIVTEIPAAMPTALGRHAVPSEAPAPNIYLTDIATEDMPTGVMLNGDYSVDSLPFREGLGVGSDSTELDQSALVADALSSLGIDPSTKDSLPFREGPGVGSNGLFIVDETDDTAAVAPAWSAGRKLTLEEAAMEAAAYAAEALEAKNREDLAA